MVLPFGTYFGCSQYVLYVLATRNVFGANLLLLLVTYALCKALPWKLVWIKVSAK